jgi:hypothetical protein
VLRLCVCGRYCGDAGSFLASFAFWMSRRQRGESLSERLRSEVQVSAALWQIGPSIEEHARSGDAKASGNSRRSSAHANVGSVSCWVCVVSGWSPDLLCRLGVASRALER